MRALLLTLLLGACGRSAVTDITSRNGPSPIACIEKIKGYGWGIKTCRDGAGEVWVCGRAGDDTDCVPLAVVSAQWVLPTAEAPK